MPFGFTSKNVYFALYFALLVPVECVRSEEKFCGNKLNRVLNRFCVLHNTPDQRVRRQIVTECCHGKCSVKYLVSNYCQSYDRDALKNYLQKLERPIQHTEKTKENTQLNNGSFEKRKSRKKKRCSCKNKSKRRKFHYKKASLVSRTWKTPKSKLGHIEDAQSPFYIVKRF